MNKVLVVGSGGRCHAIVHALSRCNNVDEIYCAPGNAGISSLATIVDINVLNIKALGEFALENNITLTIVGPEASLACGIVNHFKELGLKIFGPTKEAAIIESSKSFAKELMAKYDIPTARFETFNDYDKAVAYVKDHDYPVVLKYDGLAAGKGVFIANTFLEAKEILYDMLCDKKYGDSKVVIEEFLDGQEFSFMCLVNKDHCYPLIPSQDHKRAYDNDLGPNTGGMGAYTSLSFLTKEDLDYSLNEIMIKTAKAMIAEGRSFLGILYGGLIKTKKGIKVIEFNARFGDPETEVVLYLLENNLFDLICDIINEKDVTLKFKDEVALGVVLAAKGYPGSYSKGSLINISAHEGYIYHMGTKVVNNDLVINGGRVLMAVSSGKTLKEAKVNAYKVVNSISCDDLFYRSDIGNKSLKE